MDQTVSKNGERLETASKNSNLRGKNARIKKWTIMVYMMGDNNLSEDMVGQLKSIQATMDAAGADRNVNLVAVYDSGYFTFETTVYNFKSGRKNKSLDSYILKCGPGVLGPNPESPRLQDFVRMVAANPDFAADHYALIISGHSDGVISKTTLMDKDPENIVSLSELRKMLEAADDALGDGRRFDVLGFDSCLMSMVEVGYELKDVAKIMVASQGLTPGSGWAYDAILKELIGNRGRMTPAEFATSIVRGFSEHSLEYRIGGRSVNINAADLDHAAELKSAVDALGAFLSLQLKLPAVKSKGVSEAEANRSAVIRERIMDLVHLSHWESQTFMQEQAVDVLDFAIRLRSRCKLMQHEITTLAGDENPSSAAMQLWDIFAGIEAKCIAIEEAVDKYLIANCFTGPEYQFSTGVSVFFPWSYLAYSLVGVQYSKILFSKKRGPWKEFIESFLKISLRQKSDDLESSRFDYLKWAYSKSNTLDGDEGQVNSVRQWTSKQWTSKQWTSKQWTSKGDMEGFFRNFGRFRNFPVFHDPAGCTK